MLENMLTTNAGYLRYNRMVTERFGAGASLTYDSRLMPYQYYRIIELYRRYGGKEEAVKKGVSLSGFTEAELKRLYDAAYNGESLDGAGASGGKMEDLEKYPEFQKLDCGRSDRLWQEYSAKHGL